MMPPTQEGESTVSNDARTTQLTQLGSSKTAYPSDYAPALLEAFDNAHPDRDYLVELHCPEFTTLCPITGQPDFGKIEIRYIPNVKMVESKSLKLYLFSFRNHGDFHEDVTNIICNDLVALMQPKYIEVRGLFNPRGGIAIHPFVNWAHPDFGYAETARTRLLDHD